MHEPLAIWYQLGSTIPNRSFNSFYSGGRGPTQESYISSQGLYGYTHVCGSRIWVNEVNFLWGGVGGVEKLRKEQNILGEILHFRVFVFSNFLLNFLLQHATNQVYFFLSQKILLTCNYAKQNLAKLNFPNIHFSEDTRSWAIMAQF
jgi:hypothetical protein